MTSVVDVEARARAPATDSSEMFATRDRRGRQRLVVGVDEPRVDVDAVRARVRARRLDRRPPRRRRRSTGAKPSSAAAIERTPEPQPTSSSEPALELLQQLEAEPRRRVRAGAERAARVDRRRRARRAGGVLPRRPDPEPADARPAGGTRASGPPSRPRRRRRARRRRTCQRRSSPAASVYAASSTPPALLDLLEALGEQLEHASRAPPRRASAADLDRDAAEPAQRNALFSFVEEALVVAIGVLVARRVELLEQAALLVAQPARHARR